MNVFICINSFKDCEIVMAIPLHTIPLMSDLQRNLYWPTSAFSILGRFWP